MTFEQDHRADWLQVLRRYLGVSIVGNLVWESLQLPLYTLWATGTRREQAFALLHCTIGDAMIAGLSLLAARLCSRVRRGRALVLFAFIRQAWRSVSSTQSSANGSTPACAAAGPTRI